MKNCTSMARMASACAAIGLMYLAGCSKKDKPTDTTPVITSFSPAEAAEGATVVITGKNFSADKLSNAVSFNGKPATVTEAKATELSVTVPEDASNGKITVMVGDQTATSVNDFKVNPSAPTISGFAPATAEPGTEITITGTRFTSDTKVYFNGIAATDVVFVNKTTLRVKVPAGSSTGKISVKTGNLEAISSITLYQKPVITSFTPNKQEEGKEITIEGSSFSTVAGGNKVSFGAIEANDVTPVSTTQIKVKVPAGIDLNGAPIKVAVQQLEGSSVRNFLLSPTIISCSPDHGVQGSMVTITGKNLSPDAIVFYDDNFINDLEENRSTSRIAFKVNGTRLEAKITIRQHDTIYEAGKYITTNLPFKIASSPFNKYRQRLGAVSFVLNNKLYIGWGYNVTNQQYFTDAFATYDLATGQWSQPIQPPAEVVGRSSAVAVELGGKIYLGTGIIEGSKLDDWYKLDVLTNTWTTMTKFPTPSVGASCGVVNNKIIMGRGSLSSTALFEFNESGTGSWTEKLQMPFAVYYSHSFSMKNKLYTGMGATNSGAYSKTFYSIDAAGNTLAELEYPGENGIRTGFVFKDKVYFIEHNSGLLYKFSPDAQTIKWDIAGQYFNDIRLAQAINDRVYLVNSFDEVFEYIPNY